jgi:glycogen operon protein
MVATMMCSLGVPFLTAGDERGRTQHGNNNAYCQDNELSWLDWNSCDEEMLEFTRCMAAFRRATPALRRRTYFDGRVNPDTGMRDVAWLEGNGTLLCHEEWHDPQRTYFGALIDSGSASSPAFLLLFNNGLKSFSFLLPGTSQHLWSRVFDTALSPSFPAGEAEIFAGTATYPLEGRSVACLSLAAGPRSELEPRQC